tara:strand:- start:35 stop:193 length:159 start_codon:yes stop_codon:yes gene_type:complete
LFFLHLFIGSINILFLGLVVENGVLAFVWMVGKSEKVSECMSEDVGRWNDRF